MKTIRTSRARARFLETLAERCNVSAACRKADISRSAAYAWRDDDEGFAAAWRDAEETAADRLEDIAWSRAESGESDRMLEILLKGHRPEKYVERRLIGSDPSNPLPTGFAVTLVKGEEDAE